MNQSLALFITFLLGFFILIGVIIAFFVTKKNKFLDYIFAFATSLLATLIILDIMPHIMSHLAISRMYIFIIFSMLGILLFKLLDKFIPEHENTKMTKTELKQNYSHIGVLTTLAIILHNIIEGMAIYITSLNDIKMGLLMSIGVGLHNIPLGIIITTTLDMGNEKASKYFWCLGSLFISSFIGGLIPFLLKITVVSDTLVGILLSLTLGMLLYILIFELLPKVIKTKHKKITILGLLSGVVTLLLASFIG